MGTLMRFIWIVVFLVFYALNSCAFEPVKYIRKVFVADRKTEFYLNSSFGQITLHQWETDSIVVEATFLMSDTENWEVENLEDEVDLKSQTWGDIVNVYTDISSGLEESKKLRVDMQVWVPEFVILDIVNRYGEIKVPVYNAYRSTILSAIYCDVNIGKLHSSSDVQVMLNISYGHLRVDQCTKAQVRAAYSEVNIQRAGILDIRGEKSDFSITSVDSIRVDGPLNYYKVNGKDM